MTTLTPRQTEVLNYIRFFLQEFKRPPTRLEIAENFGFNLNAAGDHLKALQRNGVIEIIRGVSRGIRLLDDLPANERRPEGVPVVGKVAAGLPILAVQHIDDYHQLDPHMFRPRVDYLLCIEGDSMKDVGMYDGDLLAVHKTSEALNRQIVVARLEGQDVTVKRFHKWGSKVKLLPENPEYQPIIVDLQQQKLQIEGISVGVIRRFSH